MRVCELRTRPDAKPFHTSYLAVPPRSREFVLKHEEWRGERKEMETGKGRPRVLRSLGTNTFVSQVTPAGFIRLRWPARGVPNKTNALFFLDPPLQLKIFLETSFLWETKPRCAAGLRCWCLHGWGSLSSGLQLQLPAEPELRKAQDISHEGTLENARQTAEEGIYVQVVCNADKRLHELPAWRMFTNTAPKAGCARVAGAHP